MASVQDICNIALSHLGSDAIVSAISPPDGSVEAGHCARFYPIARQTMIEMTQPSFARARALLAEVANESTVWSYAYAKPTSCIKPLRVLTLAPGLTVFNQDEVTVLANEGGSADYDIEGDVIFTNEAEATLVYLRDITDTSKFSPTIVTGLGYLLASFLAGPLIKGDAGAKAGQGFHKLAQEWLGSAATSNANMSSIINGAQVPASLLAR